MWYGRRHPPRAPTVYCACGQPIGANNQLMGMKRCQRCIERFATTGAPRVKSKQLTLRAGPLSAPRPRAALPAAVLTLPLPAVPPPVIDAPKLTDKRLEAMRETAARALQDRQLAHFVKLRKEGVPRDRALALSEHLEEENTHATPSTTGTEHSRNRTS